MDKLFQWIFVGLMWCFALYGTAWMYKQRRKFSRLQRIGLRVSGVVTGHRFTGGDDGSYMAEVVFWPQEGMQQKTETTTTHTPQEFPKGIRIPVLYDPVNPADCFVYTYIEREAPAVITRIVWLVVVGITVLLLCGFPLEGSAT